MNTFSELGVSAPLVKSLIEMGFESPTDIQKKALPILTKANVDFIGLAHTGTGKTAAFGLPLLDNIKTDVPAIQALILAPTRELGQQIAAHLKEYGKYISRLNVQVVYGGQPIQRQIKDLRRVPQILVATPGRLIDLLGRKALKLNIVRYLILDEADEMLNMGFKDSIDKILAKTPADKYTWLFSATMSPEIRSIVDGYMNEPQEVKIEAEAAINQNISHHFIVTKKDDKLDVLKGIIDALPELSGVIFCRTKRDTRNLADELLEAGYPIDAIHGDLTQKQRDFVMRRFKEGKIRLITATDVVARGIDVKDLSHVIHFQLPDDLEYYTHRSGRTARAGKEGSSIALITKGEEKKIRELERTLKIDIQKLDEHLQAVEETPEEKRKTSSDKTAFGRDRGRNTDRGSRNDRNRKNGRENRKGRDNKVFAKSKEKAFEGGESVSSRNGMKENRKAMSANRPSDPGSQRFFINIGKIDDVSKNELMQFLCSQAKLSKNNVARIEMFERHSFFEVKHHASSKIPAFFKGIEIDGRALRVNED